MPKSCSLEKDVQNRFFDILINQEKGHKGTNIGVYQELVFTRYQEVINNSFPLLIKYIEKKNLEELIKKFMKETPQTPFIWKIPNDFMKFCKKTKAFDSKKYLYELMYYDWIELELYMKEYKFKKQKRFSFDEVYTLSKSARIKRFKYDIIGQQAQSKRENFLVIYYDFKTNDILYREINQLIFILLKRLNKKQTIKTILKELCIENEIDFKEAKKLLKPILEELYLNKVFI